MSVAPRSPSVESPLRVLDVMEHPHGGWLIRLRVENGEPPTTSDLRSDGLSLEVADGSAHHFNVGAFPLMGGDASDARIKSTGRVDVHGEWADGEPSSPLVPGSGARLRRG